MDTKIEYWKLKTENRWSYREYDRRTTTVHFRPISPYILDLINVCTDRVNHPLEMPMITTCLYHRLTFKKNEIFTMTFSF